jgi:hypothetical protein
MTDNPCGQPEPEGANDSEELTQEYVEVFLPDQQITITEVLRHIEAGRIVLIIPPAPTPRHARRQIERQTQRQVIHRDYAQALRTRWRLLCQTGTMVARWRQDAGAQAADQQEHHGIG